MAVDVKMFDIVLVDMTGAVGYEQNGKRPCVVIQNDKGNKYSPTTLVLCLTTELKKLDLPTHCIIHTNDTDRLAQDSMVLGEQPKAIDKRRIIKKVAKVTNDEVKKDIIGVYFANILGNKPQNINSMSNIISVA